MGEEGKHWEGAWWQGDIFQDGKKFENFLQGEGKEALERQRQYMID